MHILGATRAPAVGCPVSRCPRTKSARPIISLLFAMLLPSACANSAHPVARANSMHQASRLPSITFIQDANDVYLLNSNGSTRFVTHGYNAEWVPGYQMMVVTHVDFHTPQPTSELWLVNLEGKVLRHLTAVYPDQVRFFAVGDARQGKFVVYDTLHSLQMVKINGSGRRTLVTNAGDINELAVSGAGSELTYSSITPPYSPGGGLYTLNLQTSVRHLIVAQTPYRQIGAASWSPDDKWIAFALVVTDGYGNIANRICLVHPDGSDLRILTSGFYPTWSPDGRWIAYVNRSGQYDAIFKIHPDGTGRTRISRYVPVMSGSDMSGNALSW